MHNNTVAWRMRIIVIWSKLNPIPNGNKNLSQDDFGLTETLQSPANKPANCNFVVRPLAMRMWQNPISCEPVEHGVVGYVALVYVRVSVPAGTTAAVNQASNITGLSTRLVQHPSILVHYSTKTWILTRMNLVLVRSDNLSENFVTLKSVFITSLAA